MTFTIEDLAGDDGSAALRIASDGAVLVDYVHRPVTAPLEAPRPYLHPVRTLAGEVVTLLRPDDHVWHRGIAWSLPNVGDHNFWGGPTYVRDRGDGEGGYVQLDNNGSATSDADPVVTVDERHAHLEHVLDWRSAQGESVLAERRGITAHLVEGGTAWALVFDTTMTNVSGGVLALGSPTTKGRENAGYGGLFWRGPRDFTGGVLQSPDGPGGEELRGARSEWLGFTGRHDASEASSTLVMVDAVDNLRHPPEWFARTEEYACLCPAPFFTEEYPFQAGETLRLRYAVVIADGDGEPGSPSDPQRLAAAGRHLLAAR